MLGNSLADSSIETKKLEGKLLKHVKAELSDADFTFGNLEGIYQNKGNPIKQCIQKKFCYSFRTPPSHLKSLVDAGIDAVSLSNNHILDFGYKGIDSTKYYLKKYTIAYTGILNDTFFISDTPKGKICQISMSSYPLSFCFSNKSLIKSLITKAKQKAQIIILFFHGGSEGAEYQHTPRIEEINLGINHGNLVELARYSIDCGADIVVGAGPHVLRGIELYKNHLIAYSLGNFCTYGGINISGQGGLGGILKITVDKNGEFISGKFNSTIQVSNGIPTLDNDHRGAKVIADLSKFDFPESHLTISDNGIILKKSDNYLNHPVRDKYYLILSSFKCPNNANRALKLGFKDLQKIEIIHIIDSNMSLNYKIAIRFDSKNEALSKQASFPESWIQKY